MWLFAHLIVCQASVVDRVIAVVADQVVLATDLSLGADLAPIDPSPLPFWRTGVAEERQIDAAILRVAAGDIALYQPSQESVRLRLEGLRTRFTDRAEWTRFLNRWGLDESTMLAVLSRRMVVESYLQRNIQADPSNVDAWDIEYQSLMTELRPRVRVRRVPLDPR